MVNPSKIEKKLPGLLLDEYAKRNDSAEYMRSRAKVSQLNRRHPNVYNHLLEGIVLAIDELDKAAEKDGFAHIGLDEKGNIITYHKKR